MSRSIKFRGQREDNKEWVYGSLIEDKYIVGNVIDWNEDYFNTEYWWRVIPETVGQFTGLYDNNDREIYEGDRLKRIGGDGDEIFIIKWNEQSGGFNLNYIYFDETYDLEEFWSDSQVIGNVHDNG